MERSFYVHPSALCESEDIGERSRVWAFAHVMKGARIGADCNVGDHAFVESGVVIGDRVTIKNGVAIWDGVTIADDVFLGPNCVLTNDLFPRSRVYHAENVPTAIGRGVSIGANATIVAGVTLGEYSMIGAGAVVVKDIPPFALVVGNPARRIGWVGVKGERLEFGDDAAGIRTEAGLYELSGGQVRFQPGDREPA
ncbi:MAG: bifunctional isomerase [Chlorobi bacterium]|nr:bifunctional isomerase [Chlorobiota bacterium]